MPESRIILLKSEKQELKEEQFFDFVVALPFDPDVKTVCYNKSRCIASWQRGSRAKSIFVDPDVEFLKPLTFPDADVGLIWRSKEGQPVNSGMIFARPGNAEFWDKYLAIVGGLPRALRAWWCDQLAFSVLTGAVHSVGDELMLCGSKVKLLDETISCSRPEYATRQTQSLHWKGSRKGPGWEKFFVDDAMIRTGVVA